MSNQGMYVNGPMAGRIIDIPEPPPKKITVAVNLNRCKHSPDELTSTNMLEYSVHTPVNSELPYVITLDSPFDDTGWYCPTCRAEAEVKYKLRQIKDILKEDKKDYDEEEEEW